MKKDLFNMIRYFLVISSIVTAIVVGAYGIGHALMNAFMYVLIFVISAAGFVFGIFSLNILTNKLK